MKNPSYVHFTYKARNEAGNSFAAVLSVPVGCSLLAAIENFRDVLLYDKFELAGVYPYKTMNKAQQQADKWNDFYREMGIYAPHA